MGLWMFEAFKEGEDFPFCCKVYQITQDQEQMTQERFRTEAWLETGYNAYEIKSHCMD